MARNLWSCARPHALRRFSQLHPTREAFHEIQRPPSQHPLAGIPELSARASVQERTGCTPTGGELMFTGIIQTVGRVVRRHEKPPEVTCTSRGKPGFPASTRERPRETFFNTSRGQVPLPGLESNDALPLATRMETRLPWRPTRGSLTSPSYLVRNRTLGPPLENSPEIPPSSREEGLRLLHGLA